MPEIKSVAVQDANGQNAGYAYFNRITGRFYGTGKERINRSERLGADGRPSISTAGKVRQTIRTVGARQTANAVRAGVPRRR